MVNLKRRIFHVNILTFFTTMVVVMGLTACSGQTGKTTNKDDSRVDNGQDGTKETQTPAVDISTLDTEDSDTQVVSGKCGADAVWTYDTGTGLLQITGTGVVNQIIETSEEYVSFQGVEKQYEVKEIRIGEGITALDGGSLFQNVVAAEETEEIQISLPDSLEKIGVSSFALGNYGGYIRHIHLPHKVRYIEGGAFWEFGDTAEPQAYSYKEDMKRISKKYKEKLKITVDSKNPYYTTKDGVLFTKDVKTLVYYPSEKTDKVYRIPESVTHIEALAFARNSFLQEVVLPKGLKEIGGGAFFNDHRLAKINLEQAKKLKRICDFNGRKYKISGQTGVPEGIFAEVALDGDDERYYDSAAYKNNAYSPGTFAGTKLKSIQFPDRLKYVSYNTFRNCFHLNKISIGKSYAGEINPDRIGDKKGFSLPDFPAIQIQVSAGNTHYKVRNHILYSKDGKTVYKALKSFHGSTLVLDKRVRKIASKAFTTGPAASKLQKVIVLGDLKQISCEAFACSNINSFEVHGNVDTIGIDAFFKCSELQKFICHGAVKHIGAQAFYDAMYLEELSLGKNIESIGSGAFYECNLIKKPHVKKK